MANYEFKARDGETIRGDLTRAGADKILLVLPGLTATPEQYTYMAVRDFMAPKGFDVFIAGAYGEGRRSLLNTSMQRHVDDFDDAVSHFAQSYGTLFALGHSIGGRVLLAANNPRLKAQILLDCSGDFATPEYRKLVKENYRFCEETNSKAMDWRDGLLHPVGRVMDNLKDKPFAEVAKQAENLKAPALFVSAGEERYAQVFANHLGAQSRHVEIPGARHDFCEYGAMKRLKKEVLKFLKDK